MKLENLETKPIGRLYKASVYGTFGGVVAFVGLFTAWSGAGFISAIIG